MILLLRRLLLIDLVSYESTLISVQQHCALRGNFLFSFLHLISTRFPTFHKGKGGIFQVSKGEEKFSRKYFSGKFPLYTVFSSISDCSSFFPFIFGCYFSTACMYYRINFQSFDLFVCFKV